MTDPFFLLHQGLPREGPGDRASLDWAIATGHVARDARSLDAGCGPGADIAGLLAAVPEGRVIAADLHAGFIAEVNKRYRHDPRVSAMQVDMRDVEGPFDLVWAAGSFYAIGLEAALRLFRERLAPGGVIGFSDLVWLTDDVPAPLRAQMEAEYHDMGTLETMQARIAGAGFDICGLRVLDVAAWEAYYGPLCDRIAQLRPGADPALAAVLDAHKAEAANWRIHRELFGYALAVVRPT